MAKRKDNIAFVKELMAGDPLAQLIVMEGIRKYAEACAKAPPETFDNALICGESWVQTAKEVSAKFEARLKG